MARPGEKDPYAILGVKRGASDSAIKRAYRKLAQKYHPDRNPDDSAAEEQFKRVSSAYNVLSNAETRRNYDEFGEIALDPNFDAEKARTFGGAYRGGGAAGAGGFDRDMGGFGGLFDELFGSAGRPSAQRAHRGTDLEWQLELDFSEAALGASRRISVARPQAGGGTRNETLTVQIPSGVNDADRIRLAGKGAEGLNGGPPGDLFATVKVRPHAFFTRQDRDLQIEVPVTIKEAVLGGEIEIPTLDGKVNLRIPAGTDGGSRLRLRGKGLPATKKQPAGDLYVVVRIHVPKEIPDAAKQQFEELSQLDPADLRKGLFDQSS